MHVPLVHGCLVKSDDVIVRADLEEVNPVFIQIRSFYLLLLCPRRLLNQKKKITEGLSRFRILDNSMPYGYNEPTIALLSQR